MIITPDVTEIQLHGPFSTGVVNEERIVLRPQMALQLGYFGVALGFHAAGTRAAAPIRDCVFWFGEANASPADWVHLYTGPGKNYVGKMPDGSRALVYYWHRVTTVFNNPGVVPMVFRLGAVLVGEPTATGIGTQLSKLLEQK